MDIFSAIVLGVVQGVTEFIPVSSTGHLVLVREVFQLPDAGGLAFDAVLHLATALAVLVYFRHDIWQLIRRPKTHAVLWHALILGTVPAVLIGFFLRDAVETVFRNPVVVVTALFGGSVLFILAERLGRHDQTLSPSKGFWVGLYQATALVPGVSRSGASIAGGLLFGLTREEATRFAFLLSFPIILGAGSLKLLELAHGGVGDGLGIELLVGSLTAFILGLAAIHFMIRFLKHHTLYGFAVYRVLLAILVVVFLF
ncbi:undecaprenyl-diphosphatase UppP [Candidatus Wolfebacteria bacterium]|nr:undecaprenyl-diphosphatase UppP [Candidatus Wolfebacteria bacterium]